MVPAGISVHYANPTSCAGKPPHYTTHIHLPYIHVKNLTMYAFAILQVCRYTKCLRGVEYQLQAFVTDITILVTKQGLFVIKRDTCFVAKAVTFVAIPTWYKSVCG